MQKIKDFVNENSINQIRENFFLVKPYFLDKSEDYLIGFWFMLRIIEVKLVNQLSMDEKGRFNISEDENVFLTNLTSIFVDLGKTASETMLDSKIENKKPKGFISWFLRNFSAQNITSPEREIETFRTIVREMYSPIIRDITHNKNYFDREVYEKIVKKLIKVLKKEPTEFLKGMQFCFDLIDELFFDFYPVDIKENISPEEYYKVICNYNKNDIERLQETRILSEESFRIPIILLKTIIDEILLERNKKLFNISDQTVVATPEMIGFLSGPWGHAVYDGLFRGYESEIFFKKKFLIL